jgi:hypothetical protein
VAAVVAGALLLAAACSGSDGDGIQLDTAAPTSTSTTTDGTGATTSASTTSGSETGERTGSTVPTDAPLDDADVRITVDTSKPGATVHPEIYGLTASLTVDQLRQIGVPVNSWGGNPITRYNYELGNAFNTGADYEFRNTSFDSPPGPLAQDFIEENTAAGAKSRLAIPTLGWVAKDTDPNTCSFPKDGGCAPASEAGDCANPKLETDPRRTSVASTPEQVGAWLQGLVAAGATPEYVAMDNEPELWGMTHYDVHSTCPTYQEILDKFLTYAPVVREAMPDAAITGPVACCWYDYWNIAPGPTDGSGERDYLSWFLDRVKEHDDQTGARTLDYLDVHFYPQTGVYNDDDDEETNAKRLRSTQALDDPGYRDESWIAQPIRFVPRMKDTIAAHYPGTKLFISEWNFGNEEHINGALAIADALGIFGREGVDAATYYRNPDPGSPGAMAFTLFANYDGQGSRFVGTSVPAANADRTDERVGSYAAVDEATGTLRVVLVNRTADEQTVAVETPGFRAAVQASRYRYGSENPTSITTDVVSSRGAVRLPASSITLLELEPG